MNQDTANTHDGRCLPGSQNRVLQECRSEPLALPVAVDGKAAEDRHGDRVRHVAAVAAGCVREIERT